jgi:hypothetical protein
MTTESQDVLLSLAQISTALLGFAGVVVAFQSRRDVRAKPNLERFSMMVAFALAALLFSLLPVILSYARVPQSAVWRSSSIALIGFLVFPTVGSVYNLVRRRQAFSPIISSVIGAGSAVSGALQLVNAVGAEAAMSFAAYLVGVVWLLCASVVFFLRLVQLGLYSGSDE